MDQPESNNRSEKANEETDAGKLMFGLHVVALMDILGQSSELAKWDYLPPTSSPSASWIQAVRNTVGRVMIWRNEFEKRFRDLKAGMDAVAKEHSDSHPDYLRRQFDD